MPVETKKKKPSAFMKPVQISAALAEIVGKGPMPRTEVTKLIWAYIKKNDLQDQKDRKKINPDAKLAKVLGSNKQVDMFQMTRLVAKELSDNK